MRRKSEIGPDRPGSIWISGWISSDGERFPLQHRPKRPFHQPARVPEATRGGKCRGKRHPEPQASCTSACAGRFMVAPPEGGCPGAQVRRWLSVRPPCRQSRGGYLFHAASTGREYSRQPPARELRGVRPARHGYRGVPVMSPLLADRPCADHRRTRKDVADPSPPKHCPPRRLWIRWY